MALMNETLFANPYQAIGVLGFFCYMASFALLQGRVIDGNGTVYCLMNIVAASLVLVSLVDAFNLASLLIQVSWITIGVVGLSLRLFWRQENR